MRFFHRDATTGKAVLTDLSREDYHALPDDLRREVKRFFTFSRDRGAWISKGATYRATSLAQRLGLVDGGVEREDTPLTFAQQQEARQARAAARATRRGGYAAAAEQNADRLYESGMDDLRAIPFGQPIQPPGHHSHKSDKAYRARAVGRVERSFEERERAEHHRQKAAVAAHTADAPELRSTPFLARRIDACETSLRDLARRLATATGTYRDRLDEDRARQEEKLAYYRDLLEQAGGVRFSSAELKRALLVRIERHDWVEVYGVGPKYLTVGSHGCSWKVLAAEVLDARFDLPAQA